MSKFYRIKDIPGLEGMIVRAAEKKPYADATEVETLISPFTVVGDSQVKLPIPPEALWIGDDFLVEVEDPTVEYSTHTPFGKYLYEGWMDKDNIRVAYTVHDNAISLTISERNGKTLYSQNFFKWRDTALETINTALTGDTDVEDLIFKLKELNNG